MWWKHSLSTREQWNILNCASGEETHTCGHSDVTYYTPRVSWWPSWSPWWNVDQLCWNFPHWPHAPHPRGHWEDAEAAPCFGSSFWGTQSSPWIVEWIFSETLGRNNKQGRNVFPTETVVGAASPGVDPLGNRNDCEEADLLEGSTRTVWYNSSALDWDLRRDTSYFRLSSNDHW